MVLSEAGHDFVNQKNHKHQFLEANSREVGSQKSFVMGCQGDLVFWGSFRQILCQLSRCYGTDNTQEEQCMRWLIVVFAPAVSCASSIPLAAVEQLLKHLIYSDAFVSCLE